MDGIRGVANTSARVPCDEVWYNFGLFVPVKANFQVVGSIFEYKGHHFCINQTFKLIYFIVSETKNCLLGPRPYRTASYKLSLRMRRYIFGTCYCLVDKYRLAYSHSSLVIIMAGMASGPPADILSDAVKRAKERAQEVGDKWKFCIVCQEV